MNIFKHGLKSVQKEFPEWSVNDLSVGVVTAADSRAFLGVQFLFCSLKDKINFICYDLGLTQSQLSWCQVYGLNVQQLKCPPYLKTIPNWQFYVKPWAIQNSPYDYAVWIDSDCIVVGSLDKAQLIRNKQTFFVEYFLTKSTQRKNTSWVYTQHPTKANPDGWDYVNSGVFGINKNDSNCSILTKWQTMIEISAQDKHIRDCFVCQDEGVLNWALQLDNSLEIITDDLRYNFHGIHHTREFPLDKLHKTHKSSCAFISPTPIPSKFCRALQQHQDKFVIHFATGLNRKCESIKKYYNMWD